MSTKTDPKKRRQRNVTHRCPVVLIFGTSSVFGPICFHEILVYKFSPAGWFFLAGGGCILCAFLVPVSGTILVPVFGTSLPPNIRIVIQPQISGPSFWHLFWYPKLGPKTVQFSVPNSGHISTQF